MSENIERLKNDNALFKDENGYYVMRNSHMLVLFSKNGDQNELFTLIKKTCVITVSVKTHNKQKNILPAFLMKLKEISAPETKLKEYIVYENVDNGIDIGFCIDNYKIDEYVNIKDTAKAHSVTYIINFSGLTCKYFKEDRKILFYKTDTKQETFCIPFSFMTDANKTISDGVTYSIKKLSATCIQLTVDANKNWINNPERSFPITLHRQIIVR